VQPNRKKDIVSIQDFLLNNPQALNDIKKDMYEGIYDWADDAETARLLNDPGQEQL
jgi:fido (protein-threonine AMPylation protein)